MNVLNNARLFKQSKYVRFVLPILIQMICGKLILSADSKYVLVFGCHRVKIFVVYNIRPKSRQNKWHSSGDRDRNVHNKGQS